MRDPDTATDSEHRRCITNAVYKVAHVAYVSHLMSRSCFEGQAQLEEMDCSLSQESSVLSSSPESQGLARAKAASTGRKPRDTAEKAPPAKATPRVPKAGASVKAAAKKPAAAEKKAAPKNEKAAEAKATAQVPKACPQGKAAAASSGTPPPKAPAGTAAAQKKAAAAASASTAPKAPAAETANPRRQQGQKGDGKTEKAVGAVPATLGQDDVAAASGSTFPVAPAAENAALRRRKISEKTDQAQQIPGQPNTPVAAEPVIRRGRLRHVPDSPPRPAAGLPPAAANASPSRSRSPTPRSPSPPSYRPSPPSKRGLLLHNRKGKVQEVLPNMDAELGTVEDTLRDHDQAILGSSFGIVFLWHALATPVVATHVGQSRCRRRRRDARSLRYLSFVVAQSVLLSLCFPCPSSS